MLGTDVSKVAVGKVTLITPGVPVGVGGGVVGDGVGLGGVGVGPVPVMVMSPLFCAGEKVFKSRVINSKMIRNWLPR